jgi:hypothetical protein
VSALGVLPLKIRPNRIFDDSEFELRTISDDERRIIRDAIVPLYLARHSTSVPIPTFIEDVIQALKREDSEWATDELFSHLEPRLRELLSIEKLSLITKAHDVLIEHSQTYGKARIVSDVRPVFREDLQQGVAAAVIVHMLNVTYYHAGERDEFVVALDSKDIEQLMETLQRAKEKAKLLEALISSTDTPYIEVV